MSKVGENPIMATVNGKLSNIVVYRRVRGQLIMCKPPRKREFLTPHQVAQKERFMEAVAYAKAQINDPIAKAEYETGITPRLTSAYSVAFKDYLKAPEIKQIDTSNYFGNVGGTIEIKAVDDFKVASVQVEIRDAADTLIEASNALPREGSLYMWFYTATQANASLTGSKIIVRAKDKPGNIAVLEKLIE